MYGFLLLFVLIAELPDFSRAGCEIDIANEIPNTEVNITDFGAIANDNIDDAEAINAAINSLSSDGGTVHIPEGRWIVEKVIEIHESNIRITGSADGSTILSCPKSLTDIFGKNKNWSWSGGLLRLKPWGSHAVQGVVHATAPEGSSSLDVQWDGNMPAIGTWVQIWWHNDIGQDSLLSWLYGDAIKPSQYGREMRSSTKPIVRSWFKVVKVSESSLTIDPPLPMPIDLRWKPTIVVVPYLEKIIVENLTFEFKNTKYPGHLKEKGYNAIAASSLLECEIRNINIINADSGIILDGCGFTTLRNIEIDGRYMHHPICLSSCNHCLVEDFVIDAPHKHGTTISWASHFNVFHRGVGNELAMDAHRACSFRNLHQDIVIEHGEFPKQPLRSGGAYSRGLHAARENVYWNIEHRFLHEGDSFQIMYLNEWPLGIFVGWHGNRRIEMNPALEGQIVYETNLEAKTNPF